MRKRGNSTKNKIIKTYRKINDIRSGGSKKRQIARKTKKNARSKAKMVQNVEVR